MPESLGLDWVRPKHTPKPLEGERRRERRVPSDHPGILQVLKPFSPDIWPTQIIETSRGGLKLLVPEFLPQGTIVQVHLKTTIAIGEVRHCTQIDDGFHIGVKLAEAVER